VEQAKRQENEPRSWERGGRDRPIKKGFLVPSVPLFDLLVPPQKVNKIKGKWHQVEQVEQVEQGFCEIGK
jgi:hypothetical protein